MKRILWTLLLAGGLGLSLAGCRSLGYNSQSVNNGLTPNTSEKVYTRTWQPGTQPGQPVQNVTTSAPNAASTDPAYPNYNSGAPTPPPATVPGK